jgi:hypothetical protein
MATSKALQVNVDGAKELRETLKAMGDRRLLAELASDNVEIAEMIVGAARKNASTHREQLVASSMTVVKSAKAVAVRLPRFIQVTDKQGRGMRPVGFGTEFGAKYQRRLVKNTGGRATIVRDTEDLDKVIKRVEDQTRAGFDTVTKRARKEWGATPVKVTKVIIGWKGYRPFKGRASEAGYFLFPAIRQNREKAIEMYVKSIEKVWNKTKAA